MIDCGFSGANLHGYDVSSITVAGQIYNQSPYSFVYDVAIPHIPVSDLLPGMGSAWDNIFTLAVDPTEIGSLTVPPGTPVSQWAAYALQSTGLFGVRQTPSGLIGNNPGFIYNTTTGRLGFIGEMSQPVFTDMGQPFTILRLVNGVPATYTGSDGKLHFVTDTVYWAPAPDVLTLYTDSQGAPSPNDGQLGYRIGGPGLFDVTANSISLGNTYGIFSCGVSDPDGYDRYNNLASLTPSGATVNVTVAEDQAVTVNGVTTTIPSLYMLTSAIGAIGGGDVNVTSTGGSMDLGSQDLLETLRTVGFGIYTSGNGNVNVTALGDIDINGSRIAGFNGGNISVDSRQGTVNIGSGGNTYNGVYVSYVNPITDQAGYYTEEVYGSGIIAYTLVNPLLVPGAARKPGNITVNAPQGDIIATLGGILQVALNGNIAAGPTINLNAGTFPPGNPNNPDNLPEHAGNIDLGQSGVIGGTVNLSANGNISGVVISRQNSSVNAAQNFTGTLLSAGNADVSAGGSIAGTIIGVGGASVSGSSVSASVLGQNVSVNGGAATSTLGSSANATSTSQSASQQASQSADQQVASTDNGDDDQKKRKKPLLQKTSRVTVLLSAATPGK